MATRSLNCRLALRSSPATTPPSSADTDGAEHDGAEMPLPPGATNPGGNPVVTTWNEPEAER